MVAPIVILDFGSQTTHLIARRLRDLNLKIEIADPRKALAAIRKFQPSGLILSGGPASVNEKDAPNLDPSIFSLGLPILGICYGWQLTAKLLGGEVAGSTKEYGPARLKVLRPRTSRLNKTGSSLKPPHNQYSSLPAGEAGVSHQLLGGLPSSFTVWLSHGDTVIKLPKGFHPLANTETVRYAAAACAERKIYGLQFHPEAEHTQYGRKILANFAEKICQIETGKRKIEIEKIIAQIRSRVGEGGVVGAVSGGTESTIAAFLCFKAIGKNFIPVYVDSELMRPGTRNFVRKAFNQLGLRPKIINGSEIFLKRLQGVADPEEKRIIIGNLYGQLIKKAVKRTRGIRFFLQGTVYSDIIESKGTAKADKIKSHHNVAGLPKELGLQLLEPLRDFYTDEVRIIGQKLGLPEELVFQQPFPGPGQAVRIIGEVTAERLARQQQADQILLKELAKAGWLRKVFQSFTVMTGIKSTAVKGDQRFFGEVVALRIISSQDRMTANWVNLPPNLLQKISSRIVNEVPGISRVVYDITTKPPATMEWE